MKDLRAFTIIAILIFIGLLCLKRGSKNSARDNGDTHAQYQNTKDIFIENKPLARAHTLRDLRYAYTGSWGKNKPYDNSVNNNFTFPNGNRNHVVQNAKKKNDKNKKTAKKQPVKKYYANKPRYQNEFTEDDHPDYSNNSNYGYQSTGQNVNANAPGADQEEKKLTASEYFAQIVKTKSINTLLNDLREGKTTTTVFYQVMEMLLAPSQKQDNLRILAYQAMGSIHSTRSFELIATHGSQETSSNVKSVAQTALASYSNITYINVLNSELNNSADAVRIAASQAINHLVLQVMQTYGQGNHGGVVAVQEYINRLRTILTPTLNTINTLIQSGHLSQQVLADFTNTRNTLTQFLG
jgi:hypothetical protein